MEKLIKGNKGITLIVLVITVVIMLILAGVAISVIVDGEGLFGKSKQAVETYKNSIQNEENIINELLDDLTYHDPSGANDPKLLTGMKPVIFNEDGTTVEVTDKSKWYNYSKKQWANAETEDGSLWVWIPRFAYKITYIDDSNKSAGGNIDVVFLNGTSNEYTKDGITGTASAILDTSTYTLHPSFKKAENGDYSNGEWSQDIPGFWVAKFIAGFQQGNAINTSENDITNVTRSTVSYTSPFSQISENGKEAGFNVARNYIDGIYSRNNTGDLEDVTAYEMTRDVKITYPVFKGNNYIMNHICSQDAYSICKALSENGNIYGFEEDKVDTHLMKNSEWGACAYLGYSQYGTEGQKTYLNNVDINNEEKYIYGVTGYVAKELNAEKVNTLEEANLWYTEEGQKGSNNYNKTGVYDMGGGAWEITSALINNGNESIQLFSSILLNELTNENGEISSNKYITLYDCVLPENEVHSQATRDNFNINSNRYGDAIFETSTDGYSTVKSWNEVCSLFMAGDYTITGRGGAGGKSSGIFAYTRGKGRASYHDSFRAVVCPII